MGTEDSLLGDGVSRDIDVSGRLHRSLHCEWTVHRPDEAMSRQKWVYAKVPADKHILARTQVA